MFSSDLAVDLGTANTRIYLKGKGVVLNEPSLVAIDMGRASRSRALAFGLEAKEMQGKTPGDIQIVRPMREGVIADFDAIAAMLQHFIRRVHGRFKFVKPRIAFAVSNGITEVEKRAIRDTAELAGAREALMIAGPIASAMGAGLPISDAVGSMIVDIGAGKTEAAALSLLGIVHCRAVKASGDAMDFAISQHLKTQEQLLIGEQTAEAVKTCIAYPEVAAAGILPIEVKGRDPNSGIPRVVEVAPQRMWSAVAGQLEAIVLLIKSVLEQVPPELSSDIIDRGIVLTGGVAQMPGLDRYFSDQVGLPVRLAPDVLASTVLGTGKALESEDILRRLAVA
jgi:rod shape-determining protein MreB